MPSTDADAARLDERTARELAGVDALEAAGSERARDGTAYRVWSTAWPKAAAISIALSLWQVVVLTGWRPRYVLPGPSDVLPRVWDGLTGDMVLVSATGVTMTRAVAGFSLAVLLGGALGLAVATVRVLRTAVGSLITGLQTMPSIAWFPLAILLFSLTEQAILFVVVLGAAPAIANGLLHGVDQTPPLLHRAGLVLGASGWSRLRHVVLPAAMPGFVGGLKQGWAFAWRSLMAGELLVVIAQRQSLGFRLHLSREMSDVEGMMAAMVVILAIGIFVDALVFGRLEAAVRRRWGLAGA